jgi:hypothetical protein
MIEEPKTYDEKCAALEAAFNRLPEPPTIQEDRIPHKKLIPGIARELMIMRPVQKPKYATVKKGLQKVATHAARTVEALDSLPPEVIAALNLRPATFRQLKLMLRILPILAKSAEVGPRRRATTKVHPRKIAWRVAEHYCALTGKRKPTVPDKNGVPYGPFLELLTDVFRILEVRASAASQGNAIEREWEGRGE